MKLRGSNLQRNRDRVPGGFTLPEVHISLAIFVIVLGALSVTYLFGLRVFELVRPKLEAVAQARSLLGNLNYEIKSSSQVKIGTGTLTTFVEASATNTQAGNAIQIYPDSDTNSYFRYFRDANDQTLKKVTRRATTTNMIIVASGITNQSVFTALDSTGKPLTNSQNNRVIAMTLQFYQQEYPVGKQKSKNASDFYQLTTRVTRRSLP
jgi:prepilin-type N-terminal cleavage/methylation domain-containing protein